MSQTEQRKAKLPKVSPGHGGSRGSMPIGVLLSADGAVRQNAVATLTPPGGIRYPSSWEQESAPPLPRREPRAAACPESRETGLPRRRELRAPGTRSGGGPGPRSPKANPVNRPHFPPTLPPGVIRLDEQDAAADAAMPPHPFASTEPSTPSTGQPRLTPARKGRGDQDPHVTRIISPARRGAGAPMTGSLDVDADLFTPASERLARQTPPDGIAARHTPSAGMALGHLQAGSESSATIVTPANSAYPRRRDLRRQGGLVATGSVPTVPAPPVAPAGLAFVPAQSEPPPCSGGIPLGSPLPRRRDLRNGPVPPPPPGTTSESDPAPAAPEEPTGTQRNGTIAVGVARAAVMTMLVGVGYAVVSGQQLSLDGAGDPIAAGDATAAMLAAQAAHARSDRSGADWDVRDEVAQIKAANAKQTAARIAAAKAAEERVRAAKAAVAARAARREAAIRDAQRDPRALARIMAADRGWGDTQFTCLDLLWKKESGWSYRATNPSSGAYGIPQALPGSKMASAGADWRTNPKTQIEWGLSYIADRYGTPCGAWAHSKSTGWY